MPAIDSTPQELRKAWADIVEHTRSELAVSKPFFKEHILPTWWKDELVDGLPGFYEGVALLANRLRVSPAAVEACHTPLIPETGVTRCKGSSPELLEKQRATRVLAQALTRNLLLATGDHADKAKLMSGEQCRKAILEQHKKITLESLLDFCWQAGIPVAHMADTPGPKPDAIATNLDGRFAIILHRNRRHEGWHLFDLAHELGHVMLGHLKPGESICDGPDAQVNKVEEAEANAFAFSLLVGIPNAVWLNEYVDGRGLLEIALSNSDRFGVDAQWLAVCVGYQWPEKRWGVVQKALNLGWPDDDAPGLIGSILQTWLRRYNVSRSKQEAILDLACARASKVA